MGTIILITSLEDEDKITYLKMFWKEKTKTKVMRKCLDMAYNTLKDVKQ